MDRKKAERCVKRIAKSMSETIVEYAMGRLDKLTTDEINSVSGPSLDDNRYYYLARVLCLSVVDDGILTHQFSADSIVRGKLARKVSRIIEKRP